MLDFAKENYILLELAWIHMCSVFVVGVDSTFYPFFTPPKIPIWISLIGVTFNSLL